MSVFLGILGDFAFPATLALVFLSVCDLLVIRVVQVIIGSNTDILTLILEGLKL